ncbi:class I SAM-dependent methyltransferase [Solirhodobacter olei]|uniref:class I SAM-dependent methyltransferase n=1 Tax=Solirhodobacter olei TaxID=2493082 RepID=UPI001F4E8878|nr:class I SAM-dependent methyltransferase [Solirhodobacter olei]
MTDQQFEMWQSRFAATEDYVFGEAPNAFLVAQAGAIPPRSRVLAVADGEGRNGVWLARQGHDVLSLDFSPAAQAKARRLAERYGVTPEFVQVDVHHWDYPEAAFDAVVEIFTQFSSPAERPLKWAGMRRTLKPGGVLIIQGYTPKQLEYGTGGPRVLENLYTAAMLHDAFGDWQIDHLAEEVVEMDEGPGHAGRSAVVGLVAHKPG